MTSKGILSSLACGASCAAILCGAAYAQDDATDTIVVTAQKREQALEDVPVSVAVIDNEFIDRQDIRDLTDYLDLVPGLSGETNGASGDGINVRIRGIGNLGGNTNTFGVYIDGFDTTGASTALAGSRLVDPERVEVLRGPQGTAFGRNVVAGAISITSLTPTTDEFSGRIAFDRGNNGVLGVQSRMNIPLTDTTAMLVSGFYDRTDGWVDNLTTTGSQEDEQENYGFRVSVQSDPNEALSIKASASYERLSQQMQSQVPDGMPGGTVGLFVNSVINPGLNPLFTAEDIATPLPAFFPEQGEFNETDTPEFNVRENMIGTLNVSYDFGDNSLIWVSGVSYSEQVNEGDGDFSSLNNVLTEGASETTFASTELRFQNNGDDRLDYVGGVFISYSNSNSVSRSFAGDTIQLTTLIPDFLIPLVAGPDPDLSMVPSPYFTVPTPSGGILAQNSNESDTFGYAIFADVDFEINDWWNVLVGGRYNYDEESQSVANLIDIQDINFPGTAIPFAPSNAFPDASGEVDFDQFTWRASTVFNVANGFNVYGTVSTGYRPGGLQLTNVDLSGATEQLSFAPEEITNYEIGIKTNFFDNKLVLNAAGFYLDWTDIQISIADPVTGVPFAGNGEAEAFGFELDLIANPFDGFTLQGGMSFLDSELTALEGGANAQAQVGLTLPYAPRWQGTLTADYVFGLTSSIDAFVRATGVYTGDRQDVLAAGSAAFVLEDYYRLDVRAGFIKEADWRVEGFVTNATNELYATGAFTNGFSVRGQILRVAPPRQYGIRLVKEF